MLTRSLSPAARWIACAGLTVLGACSGASVPGALPSQQTPARVVAADRNAAAGGSLTFAGTLVQTKTGTHAKTVDITQHVLASAGTYNGHADVVYHGTEIDSGVKTQTTFEADVAQSKSGVRIGSNVHLLKTSSASAGISATTNYGAGNGIVDQLPEVPQDRWTNTAARTDAIADAVAGSSATDTYHADGSYDESGVPVEGRQALVQSYADGNALYQWPFEGASMNATIAFSPPSNGKLDINLVNTAAHVSTLFILSSWYPMNPLVLAGDSFHDAGSVKIPAACNVPKAYGTTATEIDESQTRLDVVFGQYETTQRTVYVGARYGLLCYSVDDDLRSYYDYTALALESKPLMETDSRVTLGLRQASGLTAAIAADSVALPLDATLVDAQQASRLQQARAIYNALKNARSHR